MRRLLVAAKIFVLAIVFFLLLPAQWLALVFGSKASARIPMAFHRAALKMLGVRVRVVGAMARERPLLIVSNHTSWLDICVIGASAPVSFIAKSEVGTWPIVRFFARLQRTIFVERERRHATRGANDAIAARLAQGDALVLFPEGTTSDGNRVLPYKSALLGATVGRGEQAAWVQGLVVAYPRRNGLPVGRVERPRMAWHGHMALGPHLWPLLGGGSIEALLIWSEPRRADGDADRKILARALESEARSLYVRAARGLVEPGPILKRGAKP